MIMIVPAKVPAGARKRARELIAEIETTLSKRVAACEGDAEELAAERAAQAAALMALSTKTMYDSSDAYLIMLRGFSVSLGGRGVHAG